MKKIVTSLALVVLALPVWATNVNNLPGLSQQLFRGLSEDLTSAVGYKVAIPAEPMGMMGFGFGMSLSRVDLKHQDAWRLATNSDSFGDTLLVPRLVFQKGLPGDIDVGISYFSPPQSNLEAWGGEIKYAVYEGNVLLPAVAVRATHSEMFGVDDLEFSSRGFDVSVSKGFVLFTPYLGIGTTKFKSAPQNNARLVLDVERFSMPHRYVGVVMSPGIFDITLERDEVGGVKAYTLKFGFGF